MVADRTHQSDNDQGDRSDGRPEIDRSDGRPEIDSSDGRPEIDSSDGRPEIDSSDGRFKTLPIEDWDEYFLWIAVIAALKSKDPKCQVGAVIVSSDKIILSTGFNGFARGVYDDSEILKNVDDKLKVICHAEVNAIVNAARIGVPLQGGTIYVTKFPCLTCCNTIIQSGIKKIYTHDNKFWDDDPLDGKKGLNGEDGPNHKWKPKVLREADIAVEAPFHPGYPRQKRHRQLLPDNRIINWKSLDKLTNDHFPPEDGNGELV